MGKEGTSGEERRNARRRRRRRNQILANCVTLLLVVAALAGGVYAISCWNAYWQTKKQEEAAAESEKQLAELLESEEEIALPEEGSGEESGDDSTEGSEGGSAEGTEGSEEESEEALTDEERLDQIIDALIEVMPLEDKVAGLFVVRPESITGVSTAVRAGDTTKEALNEYAVGGIVYFSKNIQSAEQLTEMIENTVLYSRYPLFIAVDEEGGSVSRVAASGLADLQPAAEDVAATGDTETAYEVGRTIGAYLSDFGFNLDFAPVADIANVTGSVMTGRSYGSDAVTVSGYVTAMMQGLTEQGVTACLKHFPGLGSTTEDTHDGLVVIDRTLEELLSEELVVFQAGINAGAQMIMVSHAAVPAVTGDNTPGTMSEALVTTLLREEMGFEGVIITDAMEMSAISDYYSSDEAAILAIKAGCDMILMPEDFETAYEGVLQAVEDGVISEERINDSLRRIYRIKYAGKI